MAATGNPNQWIDGYPGEELLRSDIGRGDSYVCLLGNQVVATFVLREGNDPTYATIYEGAWPNDHPYATIHRMASNGEVKGILHLAVQFALRRYTTLRIDTHRDNAIMRRAIQKEGFVYCGLIRCDNGTERMAFQLTL